MGGVKVRHGAQIVALLLGAAAFALVVVSTAAAQQRPDTQAERDRRARARFEEGDRASAEGRFEDAVAAFQEAYDLSQRPALLYNIANAQERLAQYAEAMATFERFLPFAGEERTLVEARIATLRVRVERQEAERAREQAERERREREAREAARRAQEPGTPIADEVIIGSAVGGAGIVAAGFGVAFAILANDARSEAAPNCGLAGDARYCSSAAREANSRDETFSILTDVLLGAGIVAMAAGAVLILTAPTPRRPDRATVSAALAPGGVLVTGTF